MSPLPAVRRVRVQEWRAVRELRIAAVNDPDAAMAFLSTPAQELAHDDAHWQERTAGAALGENAAQFIAEDGDAWVGSVSVLLREAGMIDHAERVVAERRADVVGVYVRPSHRGTGTIGALLDAAADWTRDHGFDALTLDVHRDNARAQGAYRKAGFLPTGVAFTNAFGPEIEMARALHLATSR